MELITEEKEVIDVSRLYTIPRYAKKLGISYNGVMVKIASKKLRSTWISGTQFVIEKED